MSLHVAESLSSDSQLLLWNTTFRYWLHRSATHTDTRAYHTNGFRKKREHHSYSYTRTQEHTNTYAEYKNFKRIYGWVGRMSRTSVIWDCVLLVISIILPLELVREMKYSAYRQHVRNEGGLITRLQLKQFNGSIRFGEKDVR